MENFSYKKIAKEIGWNFSKVKYTVINKSGYNYYQEVIKNLKSDGIVLDIGCGSAEKSTKFYSFAERIYLTDIEEEMLKKAKENIIKCYNNSEETRKKFVVKKLDAWGRYSFKNNKFDMVVSRHCGANMGEVYRVLKKGGIFISEDYSHDDCQELKEMFNRGQNYNSKPLYNIVLENSVKANFSKIEFLKFEEVEYYKTKEDLVYLLSHTPILNYYNSLEDNEILDMYIKKYKTKKGIKLNRKLYAFKLVK